MSSLPVLVPRPEGEQTPVWGWVRVRALVLDSVSSPHSRRVYGKALDAFWEWCRREAAPGFTRETVQRYRTELEMRGLAPASRNLHLAVIRKLAHEAAGHGILSFEAAASITGLKGTKQKGARLGTWLTLDEAETLLRAPEGDSLCAQRDRALLALLVGCGPRHAELVALEPKHIQQREGRWVIVEVLGKGSRVRSVRMPAWAKAALDRWTGSAGLMNG